MPMTKTQVVAYLAEKVGVTKKQAAAILTELADLAAKIRWLHDNPAACAEMGAAAQTGA